MPTRSTLADNSCRRCPHKIAFSDLHSALSNNVVSRCGVEEEIGQAVAKQETLTCELPCLPAWEGDADVFSLGAVDLRLLDTLEVIDSLGNPIFQLRNCRLVICDFLRLFARPACRRIRGVSSGRPHLARQIAQVGR